MNTPEDNESGATGPGTSTPGTTTPATPGLATQGIPHTGQQDGDQDYGDQQRINIWLVWILGAALLALIVGIVYLSISKEAVSLPTGLTSLASLIAGGLLALLNPVHGSRT